MSWAKGLAATALLGVFLMGGCGTQRTHRMLGGESGASDEAAQRNAGYTLLIDLLADESRVDGILMIKSLPESVVHLVKRISAESQSGLTRLNAALDDPPVVIPGNDGLPLIEVGARNRIRNWTTVDLLSGSGTSLERALLISQLQAIDSIRALSETLREQEASAARSAVLEGLLEAFTPLRTQVWNQLALIDG